MRNRPTARCSAFVNQSGRLCGAIRTLFEDLRAPNANRRAQTAAYRRVNALLKA